MCEVCADLLHLHNQHQIAHLNERGTLRLDSPVDAMSVLQHSPRRVLQPNPAIQDPDILVPGSGSSPATVKRTGRNIGSQDELRLLSVKLP